ncbi:MAG: DUF4397 domain-containing protein [Bradymonadaceae bacterium]|nr:DUF4397 domain-containing protein [Lujinxingiaceae bacterium]
MRAVTSRRIAHFCGFLVSLALILGLAACSGCEADPCGDDCAVGESCIDAVCVSGNACAGCLPGQICLEAQCAWTEAPCTREGQQCNPFAEQPGALACVSWAGGLEVGTCSATCASGECPSGTGCFVLSSNADSVCSSHSQCSEGERCIQGRCRLNACRDAECSGTVSGAAICSAQGANCYEFGNGANFCYPAGGRGHGESCGDVRQALSQGELANTCGLGLGCIQGQCQTLCHTSDGCGGDDSCVGVGASLGGAGAGFCAKDCTPFEAGGCGALASCHPLDSDEGYCRPAGNATAYARCVPGEQECEDGLLCVAYEERDGQASYARCHPICNVAVGPTGADGRIGERAQALRDATCPQPQELDAFANFVHLAQEHGALDIYLGNAANPLIAGLGFEQAYEGGPNAVSGFMRLTPGSHRVVVRAAGAAATDFPLVDWTTTLAAGETRLWAVLPSTPSTPSSAAMLSLAAGPFEAMGAIRLRVSLGHAIVDMGAVDVLAIEHAQTLSGEDDAVVLARNLTMGAATEAGTLEAGRYDLYVFDAQSAGRTGDDALFVERDLALVAQDPVAMLLLRGSIDTDDANALGATQILNSFTRLNDDTQPATSCIDMGNAVFGYCQQRCDGPDHYRRWRCDGDAMGCRPMYSQPNDAWRNLCAPIGALTPGQACNPWLNHGECAEGLYCLEYGNSAAHYGPSGQRGKCTSYCATGDAQHPTLSCAQGQSCQPLTHTDDFNVGACGWACSPDLKLSDSAACPAGLGSCKPVASLTNDLAGAANAPPIVEQEQPFCAASGNIGVGQGCFASDCVPGSECLYPRSTQFDFVSTLLSPYFGQSNLSPVCTAQCDPFDGDSSSHRCADGETCLFNYPFSAEVGHCAPIVEQVSPGEPCAHPGQACGQDSICAINGAQTLCYQFCQYTGGSTAGVFHRSTCAQGFRCAPLANDVGYCLAQP